MIRGVDSEDVVWSKPSAWSLDELLSGLSQMLAGRVVDAYLFGSHARGEATSDSDLDLILVANTDRAPMERFRDFEDLIHRWMDVDLIIYTPEEFKRLKAAPTSFFDHARHSWRQIPL